MTEEPLEKDSRVSDPWNEAKLRELFEKEPYETLRSALQGIVILKGRGLIPNEQLQKDLQDLPSYLGEQLEDQAGIIGMQLIEALFERRVSGRRLPAANKVSAQEIFDYVATHNPHFERWLEFRSLRPARHPEEWEEFAVAGVTAPQRDYAIAMREFGQVLSRWVRERRSTDSETALRLKHSHEFENPESALNLLAWLDIAEQEAI